MSSPATLEDCFYCFSYHFDPVMSVCWSPDARSFFPYEQMPIPLISDPKVFGIDTVYQSRKIHPLSSVHRPANSCPRACRGPGLILEGFVWFVVLICMSVCEKMEDSCQCRGICLCHFLPSSIPRLSLASIHFYLSLSPSPPFLSTSLCLFSILSHWALHKASKKWITPLSQPLKSRFNQK